jgi:hypothetical protein
MITIISIAVAGKKAGLLQNMHTIDFIKLSEPMPII